jgi:hypothetical protein
MTQACSKKPGKKAKAAFERQRIRQSNWVRTPCPAERGSTQHENGENRGWTLMDADIPAGCWHFLTISVYLRPSAVRIFWKGFGGRAGFPEGQRTLAGKMPASAGKMPALPRNALEHEVPVSRSSQNYKAY